MINPDWPLRTIDELFDIGAGKTMSAAARNGQPKTPFLRTSNVFWDEIDLADVDEMVIPPAELETKRLRKGDLLVCEGGEIGRAAVWSGERQPMSFQNHLHRLRPRFNDVEPHFYVYFLQSAFTQLHIYEGAANKTTIPNLSRNRLAKLEVPHPPLEDQRVIASALANVRRAMRLCDQVACTTQQLKSAVMTKLFTCGLRGEPQKETEIGPIPQSWCTATLSELGRVISTSMSYSDLERANAPAGETDLLRVLGIKVSDMNLPGNEVSISHAALEKHLSRDLVPKRCAPPGTILFPKRGAAISTNKKRVSTTWTVFDPNVIGVLPGPDLDGSFLFQWFQRFDLATITEPGPTPQLNKKNLDPLTLPVPSPHEQKEIAAFLNTIDHKLDVHRRKKAVLKDLFKALVNGLMTGEIRPSQLDHDTLRTIEQPMQPPAVEESAK